MSGTQVEVEADITLSGPLAQFGRTGILNDVARELTVQFAANLEAKLADAAATEALSASAAPSTAPLPPPAAALSATRLLYVLIKGRLRALCRLLGIHGKSK